MPAPTISAASSILGYRRNETFEFQPAATDSPTSWTAVGLPSGISINSSTGKISGSAGTAGVYVLTVSATNASGTGTMQFVLGISSEVAPDVASDQMVINVTLPDGRVTVPGTTAQPTQAGQIPSLFSLKSGDTRMMVVRFLDASGTRVDLTLATLKITLKELEPEGAIATASNFVKTGSGATAQFEIPLTLTDSALAAALSNYEADAGTTFPALAEIEWTRSITHNGSPLTLRSSTPTFRVTLDRDLTAN